MHSIWLLPDPELSARLSDLNNYFANRLGGPVFEPHITLLADLPGEADRTIAHCTKLFLAELSTEAQIQGVDGTENFFMSLFLDVSLPEAFGHAREKLALSLGVEAQKFRPHISLAYGPINGADKRDAISQLSNELGRSTFEVTSIAVVEASQIISVDDWRTVWRQKFSISSCGSFVHSM